MIDKVIVEPLSLAPNALSPKAQSLGYGATLLVFGCARDDYPVQAEFPKGVIHQRPARRSHESLALVLLTEPVAQLGAMILPVDGVVANNPCQAAFVPDASNEALVPREMLESTPYEVLAVLERAGGIYPRKPRPQVLAVAVGQIGKLLSMSFLK